MYYNVAVADHVSDYKIAWTGKQIVRARTAREAVTMAFPWSSPISLLEGYFGDWHNRTVRFEALPVSRG